MPLMKILIASAILPSCSRQPPDSVAEEARTATPFDTTGSEYMAASASIMDLLRARQALNTLRFDGAIRELTNVLCLGADQDSITAIEKMPVDRIYPIEHLDLCLQIHCGYCFASDRRNLLGSGLSREPEISRARLVEKRKRVSE
jgi:hypothetical protein